jgi:hypothetical protein
MIIEFNILKDKCIKVGIINDGENLVEEIDNIFTENYLNDNSGFIFINMIKIYFDLAKIISY